MFDSTTNKIRQEAETAARRTSESSGAVETGSVKSYKDRMRKMQQVAAAAVRFMFMSFSLVFIAVHLLLLLLLLVVVLLVVKVLTWL